MLVHVTHPLYIHGYPQDRRFLWKSAVLWITLILHSVSKKGLKYKAFPPFSTPDASGFPQLFFTLKTVIHNIMWWDVPLLHNHCACRSDFLHFEGF